MIPANTLEDVVTILQGIIEECKAEKSRLGYFAALYLKVTINVRDGIAAGTFPNGDQLAKLDVAFANRYLDAYYKRKKGEQPTASWAVAFEQAERSSVLVLQHLLLGINAHINFDLGIAAADVCGDQPLTILKKNFDAINMVIGALTNQVLNELGQISPLLSLLGMHASNSNFALIQFSIENARDGAWRFAEDLLETGADREKLIADRDVTIKKLAESLVLTKGFVSFTIWVIHLFESHNVKKVITILNEYQKKKIVINK